MNCKAMYKLYGFNHIQDHAVYRISQKVEANMSSHHVPNNIRKISYIQNTIKVLIYLIMDLGLSSGF
jgi:hypothetical protein